MTEKRGLKCLLYAGILLCFVLMFFFIVPQSDMFLFARDTEPTLQSAALGAYGYGNGRFLGNLAGMFLSHYFVLAFLPLSLCLTGMIWLVNRIVFSGSVKTILPDKSVIRFNQTNDVAACDNFDDYAAVYAGSPIYPFRYAVSHLGYKNPQNLHEQF